MLEKKKKMRRGWVLFLLVAIAPAAAAQGARYVVEDWSKTPVGQKGVPTGWRTQSWGSPKYEFEVVAASPHRVLHLVSNGDSSTINKEVKIDCKDYQVLKWSWKAVELPKGGDARKKARDDQALQIYVTFPRFPSAVRSRVVGYLGFRPPPPTPSSRAKTGLVTYVVTRSSDTRASANGSPRRNVCEDTRRSTAKSPTRRIEGVSIGIDSDDTHSRARAMSARSSSSGIVAPAWREGQRWHEAGSSHTARWCCGWSSARSTSPTPIWRSW
jgi:hypothetical protein